MKKQIIVTLLLLTVAAFLTISYFKNLSPPGMRTSQVMQTIPDDAIALFQYNDDKSFYEIFKGNKLFAALAGSQTMGLLDTLSHEVLHNPVLTKYLSGQNIFISLHPSKTALTEILFTAIALKDFNPEVLNDLSKEKNSGLLITPLNLKEVKGYAIYINALKQRLYLIIKKNQVISASFSRQLIEEAAGFKISKRQPQFRLPSQQQQNNSLANLYINYKRLNDLFDTDNTDILKSMRLMPATATLTLNYRSDALMFNGLTTLLTDDHADYLTLFSLQQPVANHLKDIFPSTTAYSVSFGVSDPLKFEAALLKRQQTGGVKDENEKLFEQIKLETGINFRKEFNHLLANEFAVVTTRYFEKLAIIAVKDGSKLKALLTGISKASDENSGIFSYDKIPALLLGDVFDVFRRPQYMVIDNYLILANSRGELESYREAYLNQKFLNKSEQFNQFDNLLAERSNIAFFFHFRNFRPVFRQEVPTLANRLFKQTGASLNNYYAASWQLSAADNNFYTNFCMKLTTDSLVEKDNK